jgi:hypothetical protein
VRRVPIRRFRVLRVLRVPMVLLARLGLRVPPVPMELMAPPGLREPMALPALLALRAMSDPKGSKESKAFRVTPGLRVPLGLRAILAPRVLSGLRAPMERTESMEPRVLPGLTGRRGRRAIPARLVLTGLRASMGRLGLSGLVVLTARSDPKASKAFQARRASRESKASRVLPVWASPIRAPSIPSMSFPRVPFRATCMSWRLLPRLRRGCGMTPMWRGLMLGRFRVRRVSPARREFRASRVLPGLMAPLGRRVRLGRLARTA